jgi:choline dehydrogenase-like flavoprotein
MDHYDVIIIGSGAGGGTIAHRLASFGRKIPLLERGGYLARERDNGDAKEVFGRERYGGISPAWRVVPSGRGGRGAILYPFASRGSPAGVRRRGPPEVLVNVYRGRFPRAPFADRPPSSRGRSWQAGRSRPATRSSRRCEAGAREMLSDSAWKP